MGLIEDMEPSKGMILEPDSKGQSLDGENQSGSAVKLMMMMVWRRRMMMTSRAKRKATHEN